MSEDEVSLRQRKIEEFHRRQSVIAILTSTASSVAISDGTIGERLPNNQEARLPSPLPKQSFNNFPLSEKERVVAMLTQHLSTEAYGRIRSTDNTDDDVSFPKVTLKRAALLALNTTPLICAFLVCPSFHCNLGRAWV